MKVNAGTSCGNYSNTVEMEYDAENEKECEQAEHFVSVLFGIPQDIDCTSQNKSAEEIAKEVEKMIDKLKSQNTEITPFED